ncbi:MAG: hypothetical protein ACLFTK_07430 [Anaerolineales bacterium]
MSPAVEVSDQVSLDGTVTVDRVVSPGPGFIVIHAEGEGGGPGPVIGQRHLHPGVNTNVIVDINAEGATPTLFAMLHTDDNEMGVYEFGEVEGADGPVLVDDAPVTPPFNVQLIRAYPQMVDGSFTAAHIVTDAPGWLVVHAASEEGGPGPVIGQAALEAGNNADVAVEISGDVTNTVFPMLHVDTGEAGVYEFGEVEGADGPIAVDGTVAVTGVSTVPTINADPQIVLHADNFEGMMMDDGMMGPSLMVDSVLSDGPGFVVVHAEGEEGGPGPVAGFAAVDDGLTLDVMVELDPEMLTPVMYPMLHVDTGEVGTYEFGEVEGADGPVTVNDSVVVFPLNVAPSFTADAQPIENGSITIDEVLIDAAGWLVVHASIDGAPGPVIGWAPLNSGYNANVMVEIDDPASVDGAATDQVFPMLHYDTGEAGVYEFGEVEGVDLPVTVNENVVVGPLAIE